MVIGKLYCVYCGTENPTEALFCRNCGAPITRQSVIPSPRVAPSFERYFSRPFLYCITLSAIVIFSVLMVSEGIGERILFNQALQLQRELERGFSSWTAIDFFSNNVQVALISVVPVIGAIWMLFVQYNTGYILGILAKASGGNYLSLTVITIVSPTGLIEYSAYLLALSESFILVYSARQKTLQKRLLKQTWKTLFIVIIFLFVGGIIEAVSIGAPII